MTQGEKTAIIKELREKRYQLRYLLKSIQMAQSTYYPGLDEAGQITVQSHCLADGIKDISPQYKGRYDVRRVYQEPIKHGHKINHKRV